MSKDNTVEEIILDICKRDGYSDAEANDVLAVFYSEPAIVEALTTYAEQVRREERYNFKAKIEEANLDKEVGERTGDATAVYEVQNVIRKIKALSEDKA